MAATIDLSELAQFYGSENWYRHWTKKLFYTDGIHYLAERGAAWLVDAIASYQSAALLKGQLREFQLWTLEVKNNSAVLTCRADSNRKPAVTQNIEFTDFPEGKFDFYVELGSVDGVNEAYVLMLTSER